MKRILLVSFMLCNIVAYSQTTVKKVILEDFTGTWCGWCPEGTVVIEGLKTANPQNFLPIASHNGDALQVPDGAAIDAALNVTSYPNGAIDRFQFPGTAKIPMSRGSWTNAVNTRLSSAAIVSVSFSNQRRIGSSTPGIDTFIADVNVLFNAAPDGTAPIKMNVYILEDSIAATGTYAQDNYSANVQSGASPLVNWFHNETLRKATGGVWGYSFIPTTPLVGTTYTQEIKFVTIPAWNISNLHLVAYVAYDGTVANNKKEVLNAEAGHIESFAWPTAINNVKNNISFGRISPNPVAVNGRVKLEYTTLKNANVDVVVYDIMGKIVDRPYSSFDVAGTHTILWSPATKQLSEGFYLIQLSNGTEVITQKIQVK